jgi:potassium-transporting ATPase potassium-binding subunit
LDIRSDRFGIIHLSGHCPVETGKVRMIAFGLLQIAFYLTVLVALARPLGSYMARVYQGERTVLAPVLKPLEKLIYRLLGIRPEDEMDWKTYAIALLAFSFTSIVVVFLILRLQGFLPLNPQKMGAVAPDLAFNTAASFITNTNWQSYTGETTMSYLAQMLALTVQNFVSAATGMAVLVALIRGIVRHAAKTIGNFWVDLTRGILYILLPLSLILAIALVSQGVVQTYNNYPAVRLLQPIKDAHGQLVNDQVIAVGPAASQIAIKELGTNGGGFFGVNSAHPFENPTPLANFLEMLAILLIPAALCYAYGKMVGDTRQGWALLTTMTIVLTVLMLATYWFEQRGNPALASLGVDQSASAFQSGGNMEGKETRLGIANSVTWAAATTAASNGSVNSMHDSFTPLGGLVLMWLIQLGEVIFGGVGSGLYGMLAFVIIAVFVSGLMVGRTPEYLGKKIEAYEMKMATIIVLIPPLLVKVGTAIAVMVPSARQAVLNPGPHGFSEILYAFSSASNNNGSAFAGLGSNTLFYNAALGLAMLLGRFWLAIPVLAIAGALVQKKKVPGSAGTLPTHTPLFIVWLIGVIIVVGALSFFPALALGPIVEHLISGG